MAQFEREQQQFAFDADGNPLTVDEIPDDMVYSNVHYSLYDACENGDLKAFRFASKASQNDRDWAMEALGRKVRDPKLFPNLLAICKSLVEEYGQDSWVTRPHHMACCVGNFDLACYLEKKFPKHQSQFLMQRFQGALYRGDLRTCNDYLDKHDISKLIGGVPNRCYFLSLVYKFDRLTQIIRESVETFVDEHTTLEEIQKWLENSDVFGAVYHDDMELFLELVKDLDPERVRKIFDEMMENSEVRYGTDCASQFPVFNIPVRFYQYFETHFPDHIWPHIIYLYAKEKSEHHPDFKPIHHELLQYLEQRYPKPVFERGLYDMIENEDFDALKQFARYFSPRVVAFRISQASSLEVVRFLIPYTSLEMLKEMYEEKHYKHLDSKEIKTYLYGILNV